MIAPTHRDEVIAALQAIVNDRAATWYPDLVADTVRVVVGKVRRRQFSELAIVTIAGTTSSHERCSHRLLAKRTLPPVSALIPKTPVETRFFGSPDPKGAEFNALRNFSQHLAIAGDDRFFAIRALDSFWDDGVMLLEFADALPLSRKLMSASRLHGGGQRHGLLEAMHRTGACLRTLHAMPAGDARRPRGTTRDEFVAWVEAANRLVEDHPFSHEVSRRVVPRLLNLAEQILPRELPCGPLHDDFAPRNVLVDDQGRVALIDMLEEWSGCVWEDVTQFMVSIMNCKPQTLTGGRYFSPSLLAEVRRSFLSGYCENLSAPVNELLLFECQTNLGTWAAQWQRVKSATGWRGAMQRMRFNASLKWYAQHVDHCLDQVDAANAMTRPQGTLRESVMVGGAS